MGSSKFGSRRRFLQASAATAAGLALPRWTSAQAPAIVTAEVERPQALQGLQLGDPGNGSVVVWSRSDRPARMLVEWSYDEQFKRRATHHRTARARDRRTSRRGSDLDGLEPGSDVFVRVSFQSLNERSRDRANR